MMAALLRGSFTTLLHEERYRRQFLEVDRWQNAGIIAIAGVAFSLPIYNDIQLLRGSWTLYLAVCARVLFVPLTWGVLALIRRASTPRKTDRICILWLLIITFLNVLINLTRVPLGQYQGVLFSFTVCKRSRVS